MYKYYNFNNFHIVKVPLSETKNNISFLSLPKPMTLSEQYKAMPVKPKILTNLGFFALSNGTPCFNFRANGIDYATNQKYKFGMAVLKNCGELAYGCINPNCRDFVSGYPNLYDNGQPVDINFATEINYRARRTVLGFNKEYVFVIAVENPGCNFAELQALCGSLGINYAINLDGGGSTNMIVGGRRVCTNNYDRPVPNMLAIM